MELDDIFDYSEFQQYYRDYFWRSKYHELFGYQPDAFPDFPWIASLEKCFSSLAKSNVPDNLTSQCILRELIQWGGNQHGILRKFNRGCMEEYNVSECLQVIIYYISEPDKAIRCARDLPGIGLTYASKLLRFIQPELYGALDSRIKNALYDNKLLKKIWDGNIHSEVSGYVHFIKLLNVIRDKLKTHDIKKPECSQTSDGTWRISEIEMALFCWASSP